MTASKRGRAGIKAAGAVTSLSCAVLLAGLAGLMIFERLSNKVVTTIKVGPAISPLISAQSLMLAVPYFTAAATAAAFAWDPTPGRRWRKLLLVVIAVEVAAIAALAALYGLR